jgi:mannose-1-phosphate guanylyltransferase
MQLIINAGGTGTRLWPVSTNQNPKQFAKLINNQSLLEATYKRLQSNFLPSQIWVNTNEKFKNLVLQSLPNINPSHILTEPEKRDNFGAIMCYSAIVASKTSKDETLMFLHADHYIKDEDIPNFTKAILRTDQAIQNREFEITTCGVKPSFANTMVGYIQLDSTSKKQAFEKCVPVKSFVEKPELKIAKKYLESQEYLWNLGYFAFTYNNLLKILQNLYPELTEIVTQIYELGYITPELYAKFPKTSIDFAIIEKIDTLGVIGMDIFWEDLGSWLIMEKYLPEITSNPKWFELESHGNKIWTQAPDKPIALLGINNKIIIDSPNGLLVLDPTFAPKVKDIASYFDS